MQFFRYSADRGPISLILSLSFFDFIIYFFVQNLWFVAAWALLVMIPKICVCSWNHHHQHVPTFRQRGLNRLLELAYAFHTGITTNAWVLHHNLGHHVNYLDQTKDESGWKTKAGKKMGAFRYTLTLAITGYVRAFRVGQQHPRYQRGFLQMGLMVSILLGLLLWSNWRSAALLFVAPMVVGYISTCWHTYYHHAGLDTDEHLHASYNTLHRWYNIMTGNLGYHTAHHMKQGLHWSRLPEFHTTIEDRIPAELFVAPCFPFRWLPSGERRHGDDSEASIQIADSL